MTKGKKRMKRRREIASNNFVVGVWGEGEDFVANLSQIPKSPSLILGREMLLNHSMKAFQPERSRKTAA